MRECADRRPPRPVEVERLPRGYPARWHWLAALLGLWLTAMVGIARADAIPLNTNPALVTKPASVLDRVDQPDHGIAMHGRPALPADFAHWSYANPQAPKGGRLVMGQVGTFDSLNPFIVRGIAVQQIRGYVVESLLARNQDEPFALYGLIAQSVATNAARTEVVFTLNPKARFSDGRPVTADDVLFSWRLLRDHGRPNHRSYYAKVTQAEALEGGRVRFAFPEAGDRELPLILGLMPILPHHLIDAEQFEETSLAPPVGSGPYMVSEVNPGVSVTLTRNPAYWGRDLPANRGLWNFDTVRIDYYREANSHFEAFKRGLYDFRIEQEPARWQTGYDFPAAADGRIQRETIVTGLPQPAEFLVFNTRRPVFSDRRVREALALLYDFDWVNRNYFYGLYQRSPSFFAGSELTAVGRPMNAVERALLARIGAEHGAEAARLRSDIADGSYRLPQAEESGRGRESLRRALVLLEDAGYALRDGRMVKRSDGSPLTFEILVHNRDQERIALAFARDLRRAGIDATIRVLDAVQFDQRRLAFSFDMIPNRWDQSLSPGNEQSFYWSSAAADTPGTRNYMGIRSVAVDAMIAAMIAAEERQAFVGAARLLDRFLMSGAYAIPLYTIPAQRIARKATIHRPDYIPLVGYLPETWWFDPGAETKRP